MDPVRVCDGCYSRLYAKGESGSRSSVFDPLKQPATKAMNPTSSIDSIVLKEQEELNTAIQLSLRESQAKSESKHKKQQQNTKLAANSDDEEIQMAIQASLREGNIHESSMTVSSQPSMQASSKPPVKPSMPVLDEQELHNIHMFTQLVDKMSHDMSVYGPAAVNFVAIQVSFSKIFNRKAAICTNYAVGSEANVISL